jgi:hypothetical protein
LPEVAVEDGEVDASPDEPDDAVDPVTVSELPEPAALPE